MNQQSPPASTVWGTFQAQDALAMIEFLHGLGFEKTAVHTGDDDPAVVHHAQLDWPEGGGVMFGSHNWSNEGVRTNRDASLIFDDPEIAAYLAQVYDYDWNTLATAHPTKTAPRVAKDGEAPPPGQKRVAFSAVFEDGM